MELPAGGQTGDTLTSLILPTYNPEAQRLPRRGMLYMDFSNRPKEIGRRSLSATARPMERRNV